MAGDLIIDKVAKTSTATKTDLMRGLAKAWVLYDTNTSTISLTSFNIASLVDTGTGATTINYTSAMAGSNYGVSGVSRAILALPSGGLITSTSVAAQTYGFGSTSTLDISHTSAHAHGDLA